MALFPLGNGSQQKSFTRTHRCHHAVNRQISPICLEFWNPYSFWWWLWKGLFTGDCRCVTSEQRTSRSPLSAKSSETLSLSGGLPLRTTVHWRLLLSIMNKQRVIGLGGSEKSIMYVGCFTSDCFYTCVTPTYLTYWNVTYKLLFSQISNL